ncbi:MAG: substrate-binding domain-containing protein, partial [Akkermansiaceae bacterium]
QLRYHLSKAKMTVELVSSPVFKQQKSSAKTLSRLVRDHADAHWILHQCPEHIQRWFSEHAIRATVLGSLFENIRLPNIDIDFQSASRHATGMLLGKGHKRLGLIRFRSQLAGDDLAVVGMHEAFEAHHGEKLPNPVVLNHNFHVDRLTVELDKLLASPHRPTGLIVLNHHHFVTAFTHLMACGIRIPQDVSIISLSHDVLLSRLSPAPVSYTVGDRLISQLAKLIISPSSGSASRPCLLVPEANPGKTVASAV